MPAPKCCSSCGAEIPPDAPGGLCASCLLAPGLESVANPEPLEPADLTPILAKPALPLVVKFHSFGDYELLAEVARGAMGVVFRARQLSRNRIVALKFIHPGRLDSPEAVRRFQIEAKATASLDHPNIVPIYEVGEHQGQPYVCMALMPGGTLAERLEKRKSKITDDKGEPLLASSLLYPPSSAAKLLTTIARAVQHAHERGILHHDLQPGNIVFDAHDQPHLTDFGLAKVLATESHLTLAADVLGSPHYLAPEQAEGKRKPLTTATDIYSLGCILYELLAGRPPFQGETALEILRQVREQEPRLVRVFNPAVDRDLETICLKCLQKDPPRRYASVEALADDLERWSCVTAISSRKPGSDVGHQS
ncbi:MAG: serine/threonine protein kinase [Verrucomicrobia bacterium]|nr:serine/threonine protein kinase [Verrucomicrobiota bacterium]